MPPIRIIIAEDHRAVAEALAQHLEQRFAVAAVAHTGAELIRLLRSSDADCLLLDHRLPDRDGLDLLPEIRAIAPGLKVIALTQHNLPLLVHQYRQAGAAGFVIKEEPLREVERAIRGVLTDQRFHVSPRVDRLNHAARWSVEPLSSLRLTPQRQFILRCIGRGMTSEKIAADLGLSESTIAFHRTGIRRSLGASTEAEVMRHGVELELFMHENGEAAGSN